jgi:PAS domain S-box-containing protein
VLTTVAPAEEMDELRAALARATRRVAELEQQASALPDAASVQLEHQEPGSVGRQLEMLAAVARRTGNAVIATDPLGRIEWVNDGFTRLTGFTRDEVIGQRPGHILQGPDTAAATVAVMAKAIAERRPFIVEVLNYTKALAQYWVRVDAQPTLDRDGKLTGYIALETDVSEQRIASGREEVTRRVGEALLDCGSIEDAASHIVHALTSTLDVRAAQIWLVDPGQPHLRYLTGACADDDGKDWLASGSRHTFERGYDWVVGVGAPGTAWGTRRPCVKSDFWAADANGQVSRRAEAGQRARIRTVCAVPVLGSDDVMAVIEIGGSHNFPGHEQLPSLVERIAQQFASFLLQHSSRQAFEALFRHSPDALLLVDDAGRIARANARAIDLFGADDGRRLGELLDDADGLLDSLATASAGPAIYKRQGLGGTVGSFSAEVTVSKMTMGVPGALAGPSTIIAVRDLTERHRAEEALQRSLDEKLTLMQEVHHRVKNNLQIISSLVAMQASELQSAEVRAALQDTSNRIQSMALVHQEIYGSDDLSRVRLGDYARRLCMSLAASLAPDATLDFDAEVVEVPIALAVPCGLVLNELLTNAFKYGRDSTGRCAVKTRIERMQGGFAFSVSDEGPGYLEDLPRKGSIGQTLIKALVRQLRAKRTVTFSGGTLVRIEVPAELTG